MTAINPQTKYYHKDYPFQEQPIPGIQSKMTPVPDCGETSYPTAAKGTGKLEGKVALITGGDSGIGRAVAIAYAREGADVAISYHPDEQSDAEEVKKYIEQAGKKALLLHGDLASKQMSEQIVQDTIKAFGKLDILVLNAARQVIFKDITQMPQAEIELAYQINVFSPIYSVQTAVPHLKAGASIIMTSSIQAFEPSDDLTQYAGTKAALMATSKSLAAQLADKGIRVNSVAPGPIWTPLQVVCNREEDELAKFGQDTYLKRAGQPVELADVYVFLASDMSSYVTAQVYGITGGGRIA